MLTACLKFVWRFWWLWSNSRPYRTPSYSRTRWRLLAEWLSASRPWNCTSACKNPGSCWSGTKDSGRPSSPRPKRSRLGRKSLCRGLDTFPSVSASPFRHGLAWRSSKRRWAKLLGAKDLPKRSPAKSEWKWGRSPVWAKRKRSSQTCSRLCLQTSRSAQLSRPGQLLCKSAKLRPTRTAFWSCQ